MIPEHLLQVMELKKAPQNNKNVQRTNKMTWKKMSKKEKRQLRRVSVQKS